MPSKNGYFVVPCPHCRQLIELEFRQIRWPSLKVEEAVYVCQICGGVITDQDKPAMLRAGRWIETNPNMKYTDPLPRLSLLYCLAIPFSDVVYEKLGWEDKVLTPGIFGGDQHD